MTALKQPLLSRVTVAQAEDGHSVHYFARATVLSELVSDRDPHTQYVCGILSLLEQLTIAIRETNEHRCIVIGREVVWLSHGMFERIHKRARAHRIRATVWP